MAKIPIIYAVFSNSQTLITYKTLKYKDNTRIFKCLMCILQNYLNSCDKEYNSTIFYRLELPQPDYHSIKTMYIYLWNVILHLSLLMAS